MASFIPVKYLILAIGVIFANAASIATTDDTASIEKIICEDHKQTISCENGDVIHVVSASYGRSDGTTCPDPRIKTTTCHAETSLERVSNTCEGKTTCTLTASNSVFGDPCVNTYKYLKVEYQCAPAFHHEIICEDDKHTISCGDDEVIHVTSASYGRSDRTTCPDPRIKTTSCHAESSLEDVQSTCEGKTSCTLHASNSVFGDPCVNTYKYLEVTYQCLQGRETSYLTKVICECNKQSISCENKEVISVKSASYGRSDRDTCPDERILTTSCHSGKSLQNVRNTCDGKTTCGLHASNSVFGDPCVNTYKYLKVEYKCVPDLKVICEHDEGTISCSDNEIIHVTSASYGRSDLTTCPDPRIKTTSCHAETSLDRVRDSCEGKASCKLVAENSVFGDPCYLTYKYLTVGFECVAASIQKTICEDNRDSITCGDKKIHVTSASYGRSDRTTCADPRIKTTTCHADTSLQRVQRACEGQSTCTLNASNTVFGDPCVGTYKYLAIEYQCQ